MKRSAQVALLLGGLTSVGAGAYALTPSRECPHPTGPQQGQPAAGVVLGPGVTVAPTPGAAPLAAPAAAQQDPCRRRSRWTWGSSSDNRTRSSRTFWPVSTSGRSTATSPGIAPTSRTSSSSRPSGSSSRTSTTSRGGFGSTGSSMSRSS